MKINLEWFIATAFGLVWTWFLFDKYAGLSVLVLTLIFTGVASYYRAKTLTKGTRYTKVISIYMIILSPVFMITTSGTIRSLAGMLLIVLGILLMAGLKTLSWMNWVVEGLTSFFMALFHSLDYLKFGGSGMKKHARIGVQILIGLVLSLPILAVAATILASADSMMDQIITKALGHLEFDRMDEFIGRSLLFLMMAGLTYGFYRKMLLQAEKEGSIPWQDPHLMILPPVVSGTVLMLLNALYLIFAYVQIRFLFLAKSTVLVGDYPYAEYARRGFFELVALSLLNVMGILVIHYMTKSHLVNKILLSITVFCTYIMVASSAYKMYLYESEYGYTQLRLYVYMILVFIGVTMGLIAISIWQFKFRALEWSIAFGLVYFLLIAYVNVDGLIVKNNLERYEQEGELDLAYLMTLSDDGLSVLFDYIETKEPLLMGTQEEWYASSINLIQKNHTGKTRFYEWNYRYNKTKEALKILE